jgi:hypothetical protein
VLEQLQRLQRAEEKAIEYLQFVDHTNKHTPTTTSASARTSTDAQTDIHANTHANTHANAHSQADGDAVLQYLHETAHNNNDSSNAFPLFPVPFHTHIDDNDINRHIQLHTRRHIHHTVTHSLDLGAMNGDDGDVVIDGHVIVYDGDEDVGSDDVHTHRMFAGVPTRADTHETALSTGVLDRRLPHPHHHPHTHHRSHTHHLAHTQSAADAAIAISERRDTRLAHSVLGAHTQPDLHTQTPHIYGGLVANYPKLKAHPELADEMINYRRELAR